MRTQPSTSGINHTNTTSVLDVDLYLSPSEESIETNEYGYVIDRSDTDNANATPTDIIDLTQSASNISTSTVCMDELPEKLWDQELFVHRIYNIFFK